MLGGEDAGEAAEHAAHDEVADADPAHVDAALAGADAVAADGDRVQAPRRHREHEVHREHEPEGPVERVVVADAEDRAEVRRRSASTAASRPTSAATRRSAR